MAPLWKLCANGKLTEVKAALAKGVDVNGRNGGNETALMTTAGQVVCQCHLNLCQEVILKLLLEQPSIKVTLVDMEGCTALHYAASEGHRNAVALLIADLPTWAEVVDGELTALMWSVMSSNFEAAKLLLDNPRVDVSWKNSLDLTALHIIFSPLNVGHKDNMHKVLQLFLAHPRVEVLPEETTILHVAAGITTVEAVKLILAEPRFTSANALARIDKFKKAGRITALGVAAAKGNCEIFKEMVLHPSIDLDVKNEVGLNVDDWLK